MARLVSPAVRVMLVGLAGEQLFQRKPETIEESETPLVPLRRRGRGAVGRVEGVEKKESIDPCQLRSHLGHGRFYRQRTIGNAFDNFIFEKIIGPSSVPRIQFH